MFSNVEMNLHKQIYLHTQNNFHIRVPVNGTYTEFTWHISSSYIDNNVFRVIARDLEFINFLLLFTSTRLRAGRSGDRIPVGASFFASVQTGPGAHPASCTLGIGSFPGVKRPGRGADHPPLLAPRSRKSRAIPPLPLWAFGSVRGTFTFTYIYSKLF
jgi:hypothetical protein